MKHFALYLTGLLAALMIASCAASPETSRTSDEGTYTIYLVRHAEKQAGDDPSLTDAGLERAELLGELLSNAGVEKIWSSDYQRTRETAAPLAAHLGLNVEIYNASDLPALADRLTADRLTSLVVGHSNTTPQLAELLGAAPGEPIVEANEYDRLYVIERRDGVTVSDKIRRFGQRAD
jgi:phosphohistidine phosphatase SixA